MARRALNPHGCALPHLPPVLLTAGVPQGAHFLREWGRPPPAAPPPVPRFRAFPLVLPAAGVPRQREARGGARVRRRPGEPPAHGDVRLPLLPSGPDGVRRLPLRRAWPPAHPRPRHQERGHPCPPRHLAIHGHRGIRPVDRMVLKIMILREPPGHFKDGSRPGAEDFDIRRPLRGAGRHPGPSASTLGAAGLLFVSGRLAFESHPDQRSS